MKYSVIIPVYNRPGELRELLQSLCDQQFKDFEVIVVDDGSNRKSDGVVDEFRDRLAVRYFFKPNEGPGPSRNFGFWQAKGDYMVLFDSDCLAPPDYLDSVTEALAVHHYDVWGGPDRGREDFTALQQAMGLTMSMVLTTGGIRGSGRQPGRFQPRSFNMGLSRAAVAATGGFVFKRLAEDIELSVRARKAGLRVGLIPEAFVYHKRRTTLKGFYHQVYGFAVGRVRVGRAHAGQVRFTHWFPLFFVSGVVVAVMLAFVMPPLAIALLSVYGLYFAGIFVTALRMSGRLAVGLWSIPAAFIQLTGYGLGFLSEQLKK